MPEDFHVDKSVHHFSQPTGFDGETEIQFDGKTWTIVERYEDLLRVERETAGLRTVQKYLKPQGEGYIEVNLDE
jgi:hypothetical protein